MAWLRRCHIVTFPQRYPGVATFEITANRRSRPQIIEVANGFGRTITGRLDKTMGAHCATHGGAQPDVVAWTADTETEEAGWVAALILDLADAGVR